MIIQFDNHHIQHCKSLRELFNIDPKLSNTDAGVQVRKFAQYKMLTKSILKTRMNKQLAKRRLV